MSVPGSKLRRALQLMEPFVRPPARGDATIIIACKMPFDDWVVWSTLQVTPGVLRKQCAKVAADGDLRFTTPRRVQYRDDRRPEGAFCNEIAGKAMIDE